jgi:hypothetical protein
MDRLTKCYRIEPKIKPKPGDFFCLCFENCAFFSRSLLTLTLIGSQILVEVIVNDVYDGDGASQKNKKVQSKQQQQQQQQNKQNDGDEGLGWMAFVGIGAICLFVVLCGVGMINNSQVESKTL